MADQNEHGQPGEPEPKKNGEEEFPEKKGKRRVIVIAVVALIALALMGGYAARIAGIPIL